MHSHCSILIAEDNEDEQYFILQAFTAIKKSGLVRFFNSGKELLQCLDFLPQEQQPQLIVLDYNMPLLNGKETLRQIRTHGTHPEVPVVVFSSRFTTQIRQDLQALNVLTCIQKGLGFDKLVEQARYFTELVADDVDTLLGT